MIAQTLFFSLLFLFILGAVFYLAGIEPSKIVEKWAAGLGNGGHFPEKPDVKGRYWLLPVHRELQGVAKKIDGLKTQLKSADERQAQIEFLYNCVFASMLEGVLVVDDQRRITLVNSEFMNIFQLTQSPIKADLGKILPDSRIEELVEAAFKNGLVQADVIRRKYTVESGRPPAYEVRAVPIFLGDNRISSVIVLFLPPADRPRMIQTLKWHSQKLNNLVNELIVSSQTKHRLPEIQLEDIEPNALLQEVRDAFVNRPDNKGVTLNLNISENLPVFRADRAQLQSALLQLLENTVFYAEDNPKIILSASASEGSVRLLIEIDGAEFPAQEVALLAARDTEGTPPHSDEPQILGGSSGFLSIRDNLEALAGCLQMEVERKKQVAFTVRFQSNSPEGLAVGILNEKNEN